jgi:RNA polymerase sigma factor for flagellar operon FliA
MSDLATTRSPAILAERDKPILDHVPLLRHIVGRMFVGPGLEREDLYGFGMLGLIAAADSFDLSRGLKFSTYAHPKIRGAILDELRRRDFLPRGQRERVRDLDRAISKLEQEKGLAPTPEEIAAELAVSVEEVDEVLAAARCAGEMSIDSVSETPALAALLCDPKSDDPVGSAEWSEMKALLEHAIRELPEQEKSVITLYYAEGMLLREISAILGVTESRVSQIHSKAVYRLNRALVAAEE